MNYIIAGDDDDQQRADDHLQNFTLVTQTDVDECKRTCTEYVAYLKQFLAGDETRDKTLPRRLISSNVNRELPHDLVKKLTMNQFTGNRIHLVSLPATMYCNLSCKGCGAVMPLSTSKEEFTLTDLDKVMNRLVDLGVNVAVFDVVGGEPLLHSDIIGFVTTVRQAFPHALIKIVTNGLLVPTQPDSFWQALVDQRVGLSLSVYGDDVYFLTMGVTSVPRDDHKDCATCSGHLPVFNPRKKTLNYSNRPLHANGDLFYCGFNFAKTLNAHGGDFQFQEGVDYVNIFRSTLAQIFTMLDAPHCAFAAHCGKRHAFPWALSSRTASEWLDDKGGQGS